MMLAVVTVLIGDPMPDTREPRSVVDEAEQAAAAGDYATAERLLREAASLQEASLGPLHPDLANTLNNLGVVCEITDKPADAERCFRRAADIAAAVLPADHSFVATSRKNLEDFLATRRKPADAPIPPPIPAPVPPPTPPTVVLQAAGTGDTESVKAAPQLSTSHRTESVAPTRASRSTAVVTPSVEHRPLPRPIAIGALLAGGLLVALVAGRLWFGGSGETEPPPATPRAAPVESQAPAAEPKPIAPAPATEPRAGAAKTVSPKETTAGRAGPAAAGSTKPPVQKLSPVVAGAQLCRELVTTGNWRCDPPGNPVASGRLLFYTRVRSQTDTTVQHRWYQGDRLRKSANLGIAANPESGYRTFSRNTVAPGEWRVELRTRDGVLLHEERFSVR